MNVHAKIRNALPLRPTQSERRRFTADEVLAMEEAGILDSEENVELLDGEIIIMAAKTPRHEDMRTAISMNWARRLPQDVDFGVEPAFYLSENWEPEPDILLFPNKLRISQVRGETALLVVEVAVTSLSSDLKIKAPMYAAHGVREYWVVDAKRLVTHVHLNPGPDGYGSVQDVPADQLIRPNLLPDLALRLADLGFEPLADQADTEGA